MATRVRAAGNADARGAADDSRCARWVAQRLSPDRSRATASDVLVGPAVAVRVNRRLSSTRCERVHEAGVIVSQAVLIAIGTDWDGHGPSAHGLDPRGQVLAVELPIARTDRAGGISCWSESARSASLPEHGL